MLKLSEEIRGEIEAHARGCFPDECCGAMLGEIDSETQEKRVLRLLWIENRSEENKKRRFKVTDRDYQAVELEAKAVGMTVLGFYHSHPNHPAEPSETDLKFAWPFFSYPIQSIYDGEPRELRSFELDLDLGQFKEETLLIG